MIVYLNGIATFDNSSHCLKNITKIAEIKIDCIASQEIHA